MKVHALRFLFVLMAVFLSVGIDGSYAQDIISEEFIPEGPRGRWSMEQGADRALSIVPGEIIATDIEREDDHVFYEYTIRQSSGSIFEVEINAANGRLFEIEVEEFNKNASLPFGLIDENLVKGEALSYVGKRERGLRKARVKKITLDTHNRKLVYNVHVEKGLHDYTVLVDAFSGKILKMKEMR